MDVDFYSLEKPWADNRTGESCIPAGSYLCTFGHSDHFAKIYPEGDGRCYHVENVPNRTSILIHNANVESQLQGCIALGLDSGVMPDPTTKRPVKAVLRSKSAIREFHKALCGEPFTLVIEGPKLLPEDRP